MRSIYDRERMEPLLRCGHAMTLQQWADRILQAHCAAVRDRKTQDGIRWQTREEKGEV
jgi:hypothetical protein